MLSETIQPQKDKYCRIPFIGSTQTSMQIHRPKGEWQLPGASGRGKKELLCNKYGVSNWEDKKILEMGGGNGSVTMGMYLIPIYT